MCGLWFFPSVTVSFMLCVDCGFPQRNREFLFHVWIVGFLAWQCKSMIVCLCTMWLHPYSAWLCVLCQHDCTCWLRSLGQYASTLTLLGSLSMYVNCLPGWLVPSVTRSNLKYLSIWLVQILVMILYCWYLLYIILSCCYCTWNLMILKDQL